MSPLFFYLAIICILHIIEIGIGFNSTWRCCLMHGGKVINVCLPSAEVSYQKCHTLPAEYPLHCSQKSIQNAIFCLDEWPKPSVSLLAKVQMQWCLHLTWSKGETSFPLLAEEQLQIKSFYQEERQKLLSLLAGRSPIANVIFAWCKAMLSYLLLKEVL